MHTNVLQNIANYINLQLATIILKNYAFLDMHYPLTDIQADFEINRPVLGPNYAKKNISTDDRQRDGQTDRRRVRQQ